MPHQILDAVILPNGSLLLEFVDASGTFDESANLAQRDIFRGYNAEPETWLLLLGFRDRQVRFSSSLDYWRGFSHRFIVKLSRIEELEDLRGKATVEPLSEDEVRELLASAPMMTGIDYLTRYYGFPEYVSVAQKRAEAARKLQALRKKNPGIQPVVITGRTIARTWWGKSWNQNLERYADYSNRIERGRSYVRHGAVLDLQIKPGKILALVQGSETRPYKVVISIKALNKTNWNRIRETTEGQLDSLSELLAGKFPKSLQELFFAPEKGLFPRPREIDFECSCPDWASMCKHVAASLYGVGARLDEDPSLFFKLRRIKMDDLITQAVKSTSQVLLKKAETKSARVLTDTDLTDVFGIKLDEGVDLEQRPGRRTAKDKKKKSVGSRKSPAKPTKVRAVPAKATTSTIIDRVVAAIPKRQKKMRVADICARVDLSEQQVRNAVARAVAQGKLQKTDRGIYVRS